MSLDNESKALNKAELYLSLGESSEKQEDLTTALLYYKQSLQLYRSLCDENHPDIAKCLHRIGACNEKLNELESSMESYKNSYEIRKKNFGHLNHPDLAESLTSIGSIELKKDQVSKAIEYFKQSYELSVKIYPSNHPNLANLNYLLGEASERLNDIKSAIEFYKQASDASNTADSSISQSIQAKFIDLNYKMGKMLINEKEYGKALEHFLKYYEKRLETSTEDDSKLVDCVNLIGICYSELSNYKEAEKFLRVAFEMKALSINDRLKATTSLQLIANYYESNGDLREALKLKREICEVIKKLLGDTHPDYASSLDNLGLSYQQFGDLNSAFQFITQAYEIRKLNSKSLPSSDLAFSLYNLGNLNEKLGDLKSAKDFLERSFQMRAELYLNQDNSELADSLSSLGVINEKLGDFKLAEKFNLEAYDMRCRLFNTSHPSIAASLYNLGVVYERLNQKSKSLEYYGKSYDMRKTLVSKKHQLVENLVNHELNADLKLKRDDSSLNRWGYFESLNWLKQNNINEDIIKMLEPLNLTGKYLRKLHRSSKEDFANFSNLLLSHSERVTINDVDHLTNMLNKLVESN